MFKRLEKHRQKKEDKSELDERWQEILGFHDTDSDESASDDDGDETQTSDSGGGAAYSEEDDDEGEEQLVTVSQALTDPLYVASSLQPEVKACIICPGKVLKALKMEESHLVSNAHVRRFKHFSRLAADAKPTESARKLFRSFTEKNSDESSTKATSKRAEKRKIYHERQKQRRGKFKERLAKKAEQAVLSESGPAETKPSTLNEEKPPIKSRPDDSFAKFEVEKTSSTKKKRKINEPATPSESTSPKKQKTVVNAKERKSSDSSQALDAKNITVTKIVRSTAERAKKARHKATSSSNTGKLSKSSNHLL